MPARSDDDRIASTIHDMQT